MTKAAFDKIAAGLNDAIGIVRGEVKPARLLMPTEPNVKGLRSRLRPSQGNGRRFVKGLK